MNASATQLYSYKMMKPKIPSRKDKILQALSVLGEATDREIMNYLGYTDMNSIRPRVNELLAEYPCKIKELAKPKWDKTTERYVRVLSLIHEDTSGQIKMWG